MRIDASATNRLFSQFASGFRSTAVSCQVVYMFLLLGLLILLLGSHLTSMASTVESLTVVPFRLLPPNFWIWTLGTFWFIETNAVLFFCHLICVHVSGAVLHSLWGWREWTRYFAVVNIASALSAVAVSSAIYLLTTSESWYFYSSTVGNNIRGLSGFDGAILVAVKQALPDTVIFNTPKLGRYKNSHFPFTAAIIGVVVTALGLLSPVYFVQFVFGSYAGWIYLRFYQKHPNIGSPLGDPSDNFAFASFFPSVLQPPISVVSNVCYRAAVRLKLCKPVVRRFVDMGGVGGAFQGVTVPALSTNQADAERRRQKALKDLNERLEKAKQQSAQGALPWPSLVDDDEDEHHQSRPVTHGSASAEPSKPNDRGSVSPASVDVSPPSTRTANESPPPNRV